MSNPRAKAERSAWKDKHQGKVDDARIPSRKKKRKPKPWKVYVRWPFSVRGWWKAHEAATKQEAEAWVAKEVRSGRNMEEYRITQGNQRCRG